MNHAAAILSAAAMSLCAIAAAAEDRIAWPNGAKAAIALTYDDSLDSQLDHALPALDKHDLKGTFFLTIEREGFFPRVSEWRAAAENGHELANHTLFHPCRGSQPNRDWVQPEADLDAYTIARMVRELQLTNGVLEMVDGETVRTFAYPCGEATAGGESYIEAIKPLFIGARGVMSVGPGETIDPYTVPTFGPPGADGATLIAYAERVIDEGGLGTFIFHGVGGDYLAVSPEAHEELVAWLAEHRDEIWVDTFRNIMTYVNEQQAKE